MASQTQTPNGSGTASKQQEETEREKIKDIGAGRMVASLHLVQRLGDVEIDFKMPCEQEIHITRQGITYVVEQVGANFEGWKPYIVGADLGDGPEAPHPTNGFESYTRAVDAVHEMIRADPRQTDLPPRL